MRPADAYRLKYRSNGSASQTIEPSNTAGLRFGERLAEQSDRGAAAVVYV